MAQGMQVWDADGNLTVDTSDFLGRVLGSTSTGASNGSLGHAGLDDGVPFAVCLPSIASDVAPTYDALYAPDISFAGTTMSWTYEAGKPAVNNLIVFGVR
jgi:hypothetical protein